MVSNIRDIMFIIIVDLNIYGMFGEKLEKINKKPAADLLYIPPGYPVDHWPEVVSTCYVQTRLVQQLY